MGFVKQLRDVDQTSRQLVRLGPFYKSPCIISVLWQTLSLWLFGPSMPSFLSFDGEA